MKQEFEPYSQHSYSLMKPAGFTKFARTCILIQLFKLIYSGFRMIGFLIDMKKRNNL